MSKRKKNRDLKAPSVDLSKPETLQNSDVSTLVSIITKLYEQNQQLSELLQIAMREKNDRKTERFVNPEQLRLFEDQSSSTQEDPSRSTSEESKDDSSQSSSTSQSSKKKGKGHTRNPMPVHIDSERRTGPEPSESQLMCSCCSILRTKVNEVIRNSRYEYKPASLFKEDFIDMVYACQGCGDTLVIEPDVKQTIENGTAGPGLQAEIAVARFEDHMPLHRQEQRFARMGVPIARSTMVGWLKCASDTLRPLYDRMRELLLLSKVIATDDTPMKVQDRKRKKNIKTGRIWIYRGDDEHPFNVFDYTEGRGRAGPMKFLAGYTGYLQGDCFSGNLALCAETGAIFVACLVHGRRYFIKALPNNKKSCEEILQMFSDIFEIERTAKDLGISADEIKLMREQEAKPLLEKMKKWLDKESITALPRSAFARGVNYCLNNWTELTNYLLDGDLCPHNNLAEHEMKRVACGRKNSYFLGSDEGGRTASVLLSLISTCKRHGVNPSEYLKDVLQTLADEPSAELTPLLPHNWKNREASEITGCHITPEIVCA